jgi:ribosomal protein S18 acetylase RimI-like enzyme
VIRIATEDDVPLVRALWDEFNAEIPDAPWRDPDADDDFEDVERELPKGGVLLADDDGVAVVRTTGSRTAELYFVHVRPRARRAGVASALVREAARIARERGLEMIELHVLAANASARTVYERWGFEPVELVLAAPLAALEQRLGERPSGPTFGTIHVQTDDAGEVERTVHKVLPRLGRSAETTVTGPSNGWIAVRDELCDREPKLRERLAKELSYALASVVLSIGVEQGAVVRYNLYDRGADVDEYLSVPQYYGELPPGDVIALGANPTLVARLTGADPLRVREVARTAASPSELPPATDLYTQIAELMGVTV